MLPNQDIRTTPDYDETEHTPEIMTSRTYRLTKDRIAGYIDGLDAMKQAVWKRLMTEKYVYDIYDDTYGLQTVDLIGKEYSYVISKLQKRIKETLLYDDRITDVNSFEFKRGPDYVWVGFNVVTIFGELSSSLTMGKEGLQRDR